MQEAKSSVADTVNFVKLSASDILRFWSKVNKTESCWLWAAAIFSETGYGMFQVNGGARSTHRISWMLHHGEIPNGLCVLHHCDVRRCVRPDHLFLGTRGDNARNMISKGRHAKGYKRPNHSGSNHWTKTRPELIHRGYKIPIEKRHYGETVGGSILKAEQVLEIRASTLNRADLARKYGVNWRTIDKILKRENWKRI